MYPPHASSSGSPYGNESAALAGKHGDALQPRSAGLVLPSPAAHRGPPVDPRLGSGRPSLQHPVVVGSGSSERPVLPMRAPGSGSVNLGEGGFSLGGSRRVLPPPVSATSPHGAPASQPPSGLVRLPSTRAVLPPLRVRVWSCLVLPLRSAPELTACCHTVSCAWCCRRSRRDGTWKWVHSTARSRDRLCTRTFVGRTTERSRQKACRGAFVRRAPSDFVASAGVAAEIVCETLFVTRVSIVGFVGWASGTAPRVTTATLICDSGASGCQ